MSSDVATKNWYIVHTYSGFETLLTCHLQPTLETARGAETIR